MYQKTVYGRGQRETKMATADAPEWAKEISQDLEALNGKVEGLAADVGDVSQNLRALNGKVEGLAADVGDIKIQVGHLVGSDTERRTHSNIVNLASEHFSLNDVQVCRSQIVPMNRNLQGAINKAALDEKITEEEANHLRRTDIIIHGFDKTKRQRVYYAVEVSNTINNGDIERAKNRAATLEAISGTPCYPAVVGSVIDSRQERFAEENLVRILHIADVK